MANAYRIEICSTPSMELCTVLSEQQKIVWGMSDRDRMPPWKLFITPKLGGLLIVAFDQETPVAHAIFTHAHERHTSPPYLYLDMMGVLPEHQNNHIGEHIILASKQIAQDHGYTSIQWTYDPLEGANANVYIRKLGATVSTFYPDYYGELTGTRQHGTKTDRFLAILKPDAQPKVHQCVDAAITQELYDQYEVLMTTHPKTVAIEIPVDLHAMLAEDAEKAHAVRHATSLIFEFLFKQGYQISGFMRRDHGNYYIAENDSQWHGEGCSQQPPA